MVLADVRSKVVALLLLLIVAPIVEFCYYSVFCCAYFVSILVLQSS